MKWTDAYIAEKLPEDPSRAAEMVATWIINYPIEMFDDIIDEFAFLQAWIAKHGWHLPQPPPINVKDRDSAGKLIRIWADEVRGALQLDRAQDALTTSLRAYAVQLGTVFAYQLTEGDMDRIQALITRLRQEISSSSVLGDDHKRRLLSRLERLQSELHKRMSDYDRAYGILIDGVVLVQKFGKAVEPITELIREISNLFWRAHSRCEELPGDTPLALPPPRTMRDE